ncbi:MAG TPA: helix-turn-helix domain-containing protein, partial [Nitrospira sp.]|nr:helix-turn-helix domain-containing protein [Nitrospira sp.]
IIKLLAYASLKHQDISVELAREALRDKLRLADAQDAEMPRGLTLAAIQHAVAKEWGVTVEMLKSKTRTKQITTPRQIAMYLGRELLGVQLVELGNAFGGRDHSTVIHSLDRVNQAMTEDPEVRSRIGRLKTLLETMRN